MFNLTEKLNNIRTQYPNVPVANVCTRYISELTSVSEMLIVRPAIRHLKQYDYLPEVSNTISECVQIAEKNKNKFLLMETLENLGRQSNNISHAAQKQLAPLTELSESDIKEGLKKFSHLDFIPAVKQLRNNILSESISKTNDVTITPLYSPVFLVENKLTFFVANKFLQYDIETSEINECTEKLPQHYLNNVALFKKCVINEGVVRMYIGKNVIKIENDSIFINETKISENNLVDNIYFALGTNDIVTSRAVAQLYENKDSIVEVDFAKTITNKRLPNKTIHLFETKNGFYLNESDVGINLNYFTEMEPNAIMEKLESSIGYDISENVKKFKVYKEDEQQILEKHKNEILDKLEFLNKTKLDFICENKNPRKDVLELLNSEINVLQEKLTEVGKKITVTVEESLSATGYVKKSVAKNHMGFKQGQIVFVNSQDINNNSGTCRIKLANGTDAQIHKTYLV